MSWHTSAQVIEGGHSARAGQLLTRLGLPGKREVGTVTGDEAGSGGLEGRAVGRVNGWTLVWDPLLFVPDDAEDVQGMFETGIWTGGVEEALSEISAEHRIYSFIVEGSSDTNGFAWYVDGARQRLWLSQAGSLVMEDGSPLPEELAATSEEPWEEQRMFLLMEELTGVSLEAADAVTYRRFA